MCYHDMDFGSFHDSALPRMIWDILQGILFVSNSDRSTIPTWNCQQNLTCCVVLLSDLISLVSK